MFVDCLILFSAFGFLVVCYKLLVVGFFWRGARVLPAGRQGLKVTMFYVYILKSLKDNGLYIGKTNNVERILSEHNSGRTQSLKSRLPLVLLEKIECIDENEAIKLELEYKKGYRIEEIKRRHNLI